MAKQQQLEIDPALLQNTSLADSAVFVYGDDAKDKQWYSIGCTHKSRFYRKDI
jgi:hypothetical protein